MAIPHLGREILEAVVIIAVVLTVARASANRRLWVLSGILVGGLGAEFVALITIQGRGSFDGVDRAVVSAALLLVASALAACHIIRKSSRGGGSKAGCLILLITAGMSANAADYLSRAGLLQPLHPQLWDSSRLLNQESWPGQLLHAVFGYMDRPMGIHLVIYLATLIFIVTLMRLVRPAPPYGCRGK